MAVARQQRSTYRQVQAQMTRDRIVDAARTLMGTHGWTATTVDAIATEAGVAPATVYAAFGNKLAIVDGMRDAMLRDSEIPALMARAAEEPEPETRLRLWAKLIRQQMETSYDVISIHRQAARADPDFAASYRQVLDGRARSMAAFVAGIEARLAPGLDAQSAADVLWAFSNEELWRELVEERGWSPDRFETWLGGTLISQLLAGI